MNQKNSFGSNGMLWKFILVLVMLCIAIPLSAKENVKIKLPDGLYMYDSGLSKRENGRDWVGFKTFFIVHNNIIYSSQDALKKFGVSKLNKLFTKKKKYKILLDGEKIGEIYNVKIGKLNNELNWTYEEELSVKVIKQGPTYERESVYLERLGNEVKFIGVPEDYRAVKKNVYTTLPQEEVDKIAKLAGKKLYPRVENVARSMSLYEESIMFLEKISDRNGELYIGIYRFAFKKPVDKRQWSYGHDEIIFSAKNYNVHFITSRQNEDMTIWGMLDVDSDGEDELIIERSSTGMDVATTTLEMYKQKEDENWKMIKKISWEVRR